MNLDEVIICFNEQFFTAHDVAADGNCYYRALCQSPVLGITDHRQVRDALCTGLRSILKYPFSEECQVMNRYYRDCAESKRYSIEAYMKYRMCRDGTWGGSLEMMITALVFNVQVISLANKPEYLWPCCTMQTLHSYQYPHFKMMEKSDPIYLYCHDMTAPFKPRKEDRFLNHFAYLRQCKISDGNKKKIYLGADQFSASTNPLDVGILPIKDNVIVDLSETGKTNNFDDIEAARQMLMLSKNIDVASSSEPQTLYSKLMGSSGFRIPKKKKKQTLNQRKLNFLFIVK